MTLMEEMVRGLPENPIFVEEIRVGPFLTSVRVSGNRAGPSGNVARCGLASTLAEHDPGEDHGVEGVGRLLTLSARDLAEYLFSSKTLAASIGMAALNALLDVPVECFGGIGVPDLILEKGRDRTVAVLGHFPFLERLRGAVGELHVFELKPSQGELPLSQVRDILPRCDVVAVTATILMNGTYHEVLPLCEKAFTVMLGPSTPLSPVLFDHSVDALAGSLVVDPDEVLRAVSQGATYRDLQGVRKWTWVREPN
jgi:uncharacterized protein